MNGTFKYKYLFFIIANIALRQMLALYMKMSDRNGRYFDFLGIMLVGLSVRLGKEWHSFYFLFCFSAWVNILAFYLNDGS